MLAREAAAEETSFSLAGYDQFQCIGAACEDTCCEGWGVSVDKATYDKYQRCGGDHAELGAKLQRLVTIKNADSQLHFASIAMNDGRCAFLTDERLCRIQDELGEDYLSHTCATFPRVFHMLGRQRERSLDLSCPEAARLVLLDEKPLAFIRDAGGVGAAAVVWADGCDGALRRMVVALLQNRDYSVAQRLVLVGRICDGWSALADASATDDAKLQFVERFAEAVGETVYKGSLLMGEIDAAKQLSIILEIMVARLRFDYVSPRYLALCRDFGNGLRLEAGATLEDMGRRYADVYQNHYALLMRRHEYLLEHYLVAYAFKTMFPFGSPGVRRLPGQGASGVIAQYMLMASYFSIAKALMIGLAGQRGRTLAVDDVVRSIQSVSRTMEHCETFPERLLDILATHGLRDCAGMAVLTQN